MHNKFNLRLVLPSIGISDAFSPTAADFMGISVEEGLYVSEAFHESSIEVTEDGTKVAASTVVVDLPLERRRRWVSLGPELRREPAAVPRTRELPVRRTAAVLHILPRMMPSIIAVVTIPLCTLPPGGCWVPGAGVRHVVLQGILGRRGGGGAGGVWPTWVLSPERADAGVEKVPPHAAELVQQLTAGDVVGVPQALGLQVLEARGRGGGGRDEGGDGMWKPWNSLLLSSWGMEADSPVMLCSSWLKSQRWAREMGPPPRQRTLMPGSGGGGFLPIEVCGDFLSRMYCVSGEGSSSYLSKGTLSMTMGSASRQEKCT
ncbi:hypothetical protein CRUP_000163 [Coryphaenoides rupestris]|nr:hypothetical protein CRUP_000163 [Coryphaenoides rupestris]